jgi:dipeptidyl aminopeptidase/acylaminoacyl peptidase
MHHRRSCANPISSALVVALFFWLAAPTPIAAQEDILATQGYLTPPEEIREALLAPWHRNVELDEVSPAGRYFVIEERYSRMPSLADFAKKHYILGGLQVDPAANRERDFTTESPDGFRLLSSRDGREIEIRVPEGAKVSSARWAPDGRRLAFFVHSEDATHVYVADPETGRARRLTRTPVLATLATEFAWSGDGRHIYTVLIPEDRGREPVEPAVAQTPGIWHTEKDEENKLRTFPSLLETPHDFALLDHYTTGQLARIDVESGRVQKIGAPALIAEVHPSPEGRYVRVRTIQEPFSKIVPVRDFAAVEEIRDREGNVLAEVASEPVDDGADEEDEEDGRRLIAWRPNGQGLSFVEREPAPEDEDEEQEEEDSEESERTDRVLQWLPPFAEGGARIIYETESEIRDIAYSEDGRLLFVTARDDNEEEHLQAIVLDGSGATHTVYRYDTEDFYADPGDLMTTVGANGQPVVRLSPDGGSVYLSGTRYHEDPLEKAPQPFVDRVELTTGGRTRVFQSASERYEEVAAVLDGEFRQVALSRESPTEVPNYFVRDLATGEERQITNNRNYTPDLTSRAQRHVVEVERADGVTFKVHVTLPEGYQPGTRLPAIFWHYPREYESEEDYDETTLDYNKNRFPSIRPRSMEHLLRRGYAVVEPDVPIIGPRERWNDYYVTHLRNSLSAAIDALDARGFIDRSRLAIGGHSYGGFGTINSMIHTPFFKAGIAGASNTNRSLTPAGFQREPRTLWEGRETYIRMSPMFWLNELNGALLMYHDQEDQNVGTFPVNSWRAFHGLNALGKEAALYTYPYEAHGPRAEETVLDLWTRWSAWLDTHVKNAGEERNASVAAEAAAGG